MVVLDAGAIIVFTILAIIIIGWLLWLTIAHSHVLDRCDDATDTSDRALDGSGKATELAHQANRKSDQALDAAGDALAAVTADDQQPTGRHARPPAEPRTEPIHLPTEHPTQPSDVAREVHAALMRGTSGATAASKAAARTRVTPEPAQARTAGRTHPKDPSARMNRTTP